MQGVTERQAAVLKFIKDHAASHGYPPTMREIGAHMGIRSTNGVNDHLRALERKGFIRRADMKSRGIVALDPEHPESNPIAPPPSKWEPGLEMSLRTILVEYNVIATKGGRLVGDFAGELSRALTLAMRSAALPPA